MMLRSAFVFLATWIATTATFAGTPIVLERDGVKVTIAPPRWVSVEVDGTPFSTNHTLYVVKPNWAVRYFGYEDDPKLNEKVKQTGEFRVRIPLESKNGEVTGTQVIELLPNRTLRIAVDARLTSDVEANFENCFGSIEPGWLAGREVEVTSGNGATKKVTMPVEAKLTDQKGATVARDFSGLKFNTRRGTVTMKTSAAADWQLLDYRRNLWGDERNQFWVGVADGSITPDKPRQYEMTWQFASPASGVMARPPLQVTDKLTSAEQVVRPEPARDLLIPTPKQITWLEKNLLLPVEPTVSMSGQGLDREFALQVLSTLISDIERKTGYTLKEGEAGKSNIEFRLTAGSTKRPEEYTVEVGDTAVLEAATTQGLVNAAATLRQLMREEQGHGAVRGVKMRDWPALPFRGIHFFTGRDGRDLQMKMLQDVLGGLKLNALVYQCEYIKWETHPEIHHTTYGMEMADARDVIGEAKSRFIETIPLINTFGHSEWMLDNDVYRHLADNPEVPYAYDPSTSEPIRIAEEIYDEAIRLFQPRYFHIGKDEIMAPGFPMKEANRKVGAQKLILDDIAHYHKFLKDRGIRAMMWGDMFLHGDEAPDATNAASQEEAKMLRSKLPKDIIITDWHYAPAPVAKYRSLDIFNREGFDTIAAPWNSPTNVLRFAKAAVDARQAAEKRGKGGTTMGTLQTTWAGYSFGHYSFWEAPNQYGAYVLAAEAAWTGGLEDADAVPFNFREEFDRIWYGNRLPREPMQGWFADLSAQANFDMVPSPGDKQWLGYDVTGKASDVTAPTGEFLGRFRARPSGADGPMRGVLLAASFNPKGMWPTQLDVAVGTKATAVYSLLAATHAGQPFDALGRVHFQYTDDTEETVPLELGERVFAFNDTRVKPESPIVWKAPAQAGLPQRIIHAYVWRNPNPEKELKNVRFTSSERGSGVIIFGVGGVQAPLPEVKLYTKPPTP